MTIPTRVSPYRQVRIGRPLVHVFTLPAKGNPVDRAPQRMNRFKDNWLLAAAVLIPSCACVMAWLAGQQANEVHVEAGASLCGALLEQQLVDEIVVYIAPHIMGSDARGLFCIAGLERMADRIELDISDVRQIGSDLRITAVPVAE